MTSRGFTCHEPYTEVVYTWGFFEPYIKGEIIRMPDDFEDRSMEVLDVIENTTPKEFAAIIQLIRES